MKNLFQILVLLFCFANFSNAQDNFIQKHMKQEMENDNFTSINFSMNASFAKEIVNEIKEDMGGTGKQFMNLIKNLHKLNILTTEKQAAKYYKNALAIMKKEKYQTIMTIKEGTKSGVNIMAKENKKGIEEILMLVGGEDEFVVICFSGK